MKLRRHAKDLFSSQMRSMLSESKVMYVSEGSEAGTGSLWPCLQDLLTEAMNEHEQHSWAA